MPKKLLPIFKEHNLKSIHNELDDYWNEIYVVTNIQRTQFKINSQQSISSIKKASVVTNIQRTQFKINSQQLIGK